jgi:hypothetical protein
MRNILLALFIFIAIGCRVHAGDAQDFVTLDPEGPDRSAWWVRARFHPFETQVRGVPVQKIRKGWCKASEFRRELFPQDLQEDLKSTNFAIDGFFAGSKTKQKALVGAYETCAGETGDFFLILDWPDRGSPTVRFVWGAPIDHPFAHVRVEPDSTIQVWHCMDCDFVTRYKWDRSKRTFAVVPEEY